MPIYAPGVAVGISQKMKEEPGRIVDNRLNRLVKFDQVSNSAIETASRNRFTDQTVCGTAPSIQFVRSFLFKQKVA